jgi:hypothetical protein
MRTRKSTKRSKKRLRKNKQSWSSRRAFGNKRKAIRSSRCHEMFERKEKQRDLIYKSTCILTRNILPKNVDHPLNCETMFCTEWSLNWNLPSMKK